MMLRYFFIATLAVALALAGGARGAGALTLEQAVDFALKNNHTIKRFQHLLDSSRAGVGSKQSAFLPTVSLGYSYTHLESRGSSALSSALTTSTAVASVGASYNLFNGFTDIKGLKEAEARVRVSEYQKRATVADVVLGAKTSYIDVLRARRAVDVAAEGVELLERQTREAGAFYREGLFARNDVLKVEVELSSAQQDLLAARGDLAVARKRLARVINVDISDDEVITDFEGLPLVQETSFEVLGNRAIEGRSELKELAALGEAYRLSAEGSRGGYLPNLDISISHNRYGDGALADGRSQLSDSDVRAVLTASWDVFDGFTSKYGSEKSMALAEATDEQLRDLQLEVLLQLMEALEGYSVSLGKLGAAGKAVEQAQENYRVTDNQFRERIATSTDLLDARFLITRARNQHNNALYDVHAWAARLERVMEGSEQAAQIAQQK